MPSCLIEKRNCHLLRICFNLSQFESNTSRTIAKGQLKLESSKYDQFCFQAKWLWRSCVQLIEVKSKAFSEPVVCDLFSFTSWVIVTNPMAEKAKSDIITWLIPGVASSVFVCIFMLITSDPMRSVELLLSEGSVGRFPSRSTCLQLLQTWNHEFPYLLLHSVIVC